MILKVSKDGKAELKKEMYSAATGNMGDARCFL
jgi:hypothetical protein